MTTGERIVGEWISAGRPRDLARRIDEALARVEGENLNLKQRHTGCHAERDELASRLALAERVVEALRKTPPIVSAYTGFMLGDFSAMQEYVERLLRRPVFTHEFARKELCHEASKSDFVVLSSEIHEALSLWDRGKGE